MHFTVEQQGSIFRRSAGLQAYYPRVVRLDGCELLTSFVLGKALESDDSRPALARSLDGGLTWRFAGPVDGASEGFTETGFISLDGDGSLLCTGARWERRPELPLVHPETLGMRDNCVVWRRSFDGGRSWSEPCPVPSPAEVPLEVPTGIVALPGGSWLLSCAAWRRCDGEAPLGHRVMVLISDNQGRSWTHAGEPFHDPQGRVGYWESRVSTMGGPRLIATCWAHDWEREEDLANPFCFSQDGGRSWSAPAVSPVRGQTGWPLWLGGDRILFVYNHRREPYGIRGQIAEVWEGSWITFFDAPIWSCCDRPAGSPASDRYQVPHFQFGAPSALRLDRKRVLVVFWSVRGGRAGIDWTLLEMR